MSLPDFWWLVSMACVAWYSSITVYVSIKGVSDIRGMLARLQSLNQESSEENP